MKTRIDQWIDGLSWDWCISRQRYFGVPFPIWYSKRAGEEGKILIATPDQLPVNPLTDVPKGYNIDEVVPELDVMDTWATSSVSPQLSSKGITDALTLDAKRHKQLFPADLRPQAHEIIRTWAFYTIVKAHLHENTIPWHNLMISGWCLASDKTKMSKSKGNVVTPVKLLEEKGSDSVRYWASTSKLGTDTAFSEDVLKIGHKLVNKLFNASKFAAMQIAHLDTLPTATAADDVKNGIITAALDKWIISRLSKAISKAQQAFEAYEYADARAAAEDFFWNDFCDNYLELVKSRAYGNMGNAAQQSACHTIYYCLNGILKLFAPIVPHVTEEIFSCIYADEYNAKGSIHARGMWPDATVYPANETAEKAGIEIVALLETVRRAKSEKNVSIKAPLKTMHISTTLDDEAVWSAIKAAEEDLKAATTTESIVWKAGEGDNFTSEGGLHSIALTYAESEEVA
jgi:valyl-tRNA synthetase